MSSIPEAPPDEAAPSPDAAITAIPAAVNADVDAAIANGETLPGELPEDDDDDLYSEGEGEVVLNTAEHTVATVDGAEQQDEVNDATHEAEADARAGVKVGADADTDAEAEAVDNAVDASDEAYASNTQEAGNDPDADDVKAADAADENKAEVNEGSTEAQPSAADEAVPGTVPAESTPPTEPIAQAATKESQPDADQGSAVDAVDAVDAAAAAAADDEPSAPDASADAPSQAVAPEVETEAASYIPLVDDNDAEEDGEIVEEDADVDADVEDSASAAQNGASSSSPLPYIDDIAMMDTGELGDIQPSAPTESSFTSSIQAQATSATSASTTNDSGPGIDFDKMIDAISGNAAKDTAKPLITVTGSQVPIGAPKGPANPFPRPPTGPARMTGRFANNPNLPNAPKVSAAGTVPHGIPPQFPAAAGGRRAQAAARAAQGQGQPPTAPRQANNNRERAAVDRAYHAFLNEEKIHVAEGKWEAFPEGSRMFVGNLSQERVSKRDVFEHFHRYGRLAQIAIKSAYGFVQYHSAAEASAAMRELEGVEIKGRKIHLEISKLPQITKGRERESGLVGRENDRARGGKDRSPERAKNRGGRDRDGDRYDGRGQDNSRRSRDDHYAGSPNGHGMSPHHGHGRSDSYGRGRGGRDDYSRRSRDRSRSPSRHGSHGDGRGYRSRRSPSPYGRNRDSSGHGNADALKTRYGSDVPDVQLLVAQGLDREFIKWVQVPFHERGLKTDVILLTPHTPPRDSIIQVHVLEGVTAVVDLDTRSQANGTIPVQVFNRLGGVSNIRFDGYQDLTPSVAADVVVRAKSATAAQQAPRYPPHQPPYSQGYQAAPSFSQPYAPPPTTVAPGNGIDLASLVGQLDNATLAQLLSAIQAPQAPQATPTCGQPPAAPQYAVSGNASQEAQLAALLGTLGAAAGAPPAPAAAFAYGSAPAPYGAPPAPGYQTALPQGLDEQSIQALMAHFAQSRQ
ncbi:nuclear polyadenylated RNA-binding protein 3 [Sporothrix stenoceras]|uniref:Nuclear polyadenylated RNA-binding protein 3 n=1 Tax=Sporothrix stenoceras TaxID=5173 RepID=A0ABR3ZFS4_9PEZI